MRGDVHELPSPRGARGPEQRGRRFAVILQNDDLPLSTVLVAPTSRTAAPATFRSAVTVAGESTLVLAEQAVAVDPSRLGALVGHLSRAELEDVTRCLRLVLDLA